MISVEKLKKSYGELEVLKGIDLSISEGEIVSIVGKSGAGKSTLLHILGTLDRPDSGTYYLDGMNTSDLGEKELAKMRNDKIGFVFQFHHLLNEFTALENVCIPAYIKGRAKLECEKKAKEILSYLGLSERIDHKPNQLSGGEQQRVAFARAMINDPAVIFADEPTGNLDSEISAELHELIFQLRKDFNQTFVIVTHNNELASLSDRSIRMENGLLVD